MKKVMLIGAFVVLSNSGELCAMSQDLVAVGNNSQLSVRSSDFAETRAVVPASQDTVIRRQQAWRYADSFELSGENAIIMLEKGDASEGMFVVEDTIEKSYPCERTFLNLEQATANSSYAVYQLFANTEELGRLLVSDHYVDRDNALPHQTRFSADRYDDDHLCSIGTLVTFVMDRDNIERQISSVSNSTQAYRLDRTLQDNQYESNPNGGHNVRVYVRPDGHEVRKNWEGVALKLKPATPAPTSQPPAQSGYTSSGGYSSNILEGAGQRVADNCHIM